MKKILILERSEEYVKKVKTAFEKNTQFFTANRSHQALMRICQANPEIIILGTNIGDLDTLKFVRQLKIVSPSKIIIVVEQSYTTKHCKQFKKAGVWEYIRKSSNIDILVETVNEALKIEKNGDCYDKLEILKEILGCSNEISKFRLNVLNYSQQDEPIILLGESGTGKDLAASCIHRMSNRFEYPYLNINCGAIPPTLIESELFGMEKGAFTDAKTMPGKFEQAGKGTIFLNEIGELPCYTQVKLLRILESNTVTRLGGEHEKPINAKIITATNKDLKKAVKDKSFRADLLYRINTLYLNIPPLRKRKDDIPILAHKFLEDKKYPKELSLNAMEKLYEHNWPGNIRELRNVIKRAKATSVTEKINSSEIIFF
ncbi:MAG: sigma-54-dependent Fis family transcriptional regulator [Spirochaetales bacterium]|nr:sigma-54-dependent Fis family transcriptional regulator [Spirochaetales bacterium]